MWKINFTVQNTGGLNTGIPGICSPIDTHCLVVRSIKCTVEFKWVELALLAGSMEYLYHVVTSDRKLSVMECVNISVFQASCSIGR